jgi:RimJ/RimL family protein N-acetyltransferase
MIEIGRPVGVIHAIDYETGSSYHPVIKIPEVGLYIGEVELWGQGVGKQALTQMLELLPERAAYAVIHRKNERSIKLFTSLGFKKIGKARKGQELYLFQILQAEVKCLRSLQSPSLTLQPSTGV